jgi:FAR-17a/AIG1-like protein
MTAAGISTARGFGATPGGARGSAMHSRLNHHGQHGSSQNGLGTRRRAAAATTSAGGSGLGAVAPHGARVGDVVISDPGRALRWARFAYYGVFAPLLLYGIYVQLIVLKGPGRTPIPASVLFGRDSVFLTFHGNFHCTWYAVLCFLHALVMLRARKGSATALRPNLRRSAAVRGIERLIHYYTGPLFALGSFVGLAYYLLLHFHPLTRLRARLVPDYDEKMALLHLAPMLFVLGDVVLKDEELVRKYCMSSRRGSRFIVVYGAGYFMWSVFCVWKNGGNWPYPFQPKFTAVQHIMFVSTVLLCATYLTMAGHKIMARLDRNRRRRLANRGSRLSPSSGHTVRRRAISAESVRSSA